MWFIVCFPGVTNNLQYWDFNSELLYRQNVKQKNNYLKGLVGF